jgi:hypothetical protein
MIKSTNQFKAVTTVTENLASKGLHTRGGTETLVKAGHVTR